MAPKLEQVFAMRGYMSKENTVNLKEIKGGPVRIVVPITHGFIKGSGLEAEILPGGGDWILLDTSTGVAHLDVRTQARTSDGHELYVHYHGVLKIDEAANKVLAWSPDAKTTKSGEHEWFSAPIIETSDPKFKWVETSLWVGQGHWVADETGFAVEYEIYKVVN
ncbi:hypothetical protein LTR99_001298 [Exophiala xenobiotica]|uniref:Uncharacterized protein n=1 Tax=Vermiconidia calcicola TaxID=1690605 RepID=A0AAV9QQN6_9PEZI|nr:hypothetical protein H2202_009442 [Exophiala xenobiotica]KAK5545860.1 hypothetical protein LTR25_000870 [Vermiconidia calcicola]KAK5549880.1 hypothetical protein LTR23_000171 [Chaetothyriales sp. CCFEE 6169]KAK5199257.1 hypothetical protein LTR92_001731 [Exophiala xenobiotica]KAK5204802.1 hypothetical protein LTR41_009338 [Exophiala xenobiotica]